MRLQLIEAFVTFNESTSLTVAAARLGITQPALSKQLAALEREFQQKLFTMQGRRKVLTPFGRTLHESLRARFLDLPDLIAQAQAQHAEPALARLRISARRGVLDRIAPRLKFAGTLVFKEDSNEGTIQALLHQQAEVGLVHAVPDTPELIMKPLFKEEFVIAIPRRFVRARPAFGEELRRELATLPALAYRERDELLLAICEAKPCRVTEDYSSLKEMVEAGLGWSVLPEYLAPEGAWTVPVPPRALPARQFSIAYRPEFARIGWFKDLVSEIRDCFVSAASYGARRAP